MRSDGLETTGEVGRSSPAMAGVDEHRKTEGDPTLDRQPAKVAKERPLDEKLHCFSDHDQVFTFHRCGLIAG